MKKIISVFLLISFVFASITLVTSADSSKSEKNVRSSVYTYTSASFDFNVSGAYLIEAETGRVLYAQNEFERRSPASVTKVMTLLLVSEALRDGKYSLSDVVTVSRKAASMGGSQVFLEEGERISVEDLIKSTVIASGNDSSLALAEFTAGSEAEFVRMMNEKAIELGLSNTHFENTTGLDDTTREHYSCARDIGIMSKELIKHDIILKYSSIWQDTIRDGEFTLTNTNRLVRYYDGCNGLKTGSTDKAGYCIAASAKRGNMQLIAVIMGAETKDERNEAARELLDFGFANYTLYENGGKLVENVKVLKGKCDNVNLYSTGFSSVIEKNKQGKIELYYDIPEELIAPINKGDVVGEIVFKIDGEIIGKCDVFSNENVDALTLYSIFLKIIKRMVLG